MKKPAGIDPLADRILERLANHPESAEVVLGGYLVLQHYVDYRTTHDVDAWWRKTSSHDTEKAILAAMQGIAAKEDSRVRERRFGETLSIELVQQGRKRFSFQISVRSIELEPPTTSLWPPILMETLTDNAASKMNALVNRGSPRDFLDVRAIIEHNLLDAAACWSLWAKKNPGQSMEEAKQKALLHLARLESRRPLESIGDPVERERARSIRAWFTHEFSRA